MNARLACAVAVFTTIASSTGCTGSDENSGTLRVSAAGLTHVGEVDRVVVSVTPGGYATDLVLDHSDGQFRGSLVVPTGEYALRVDAFDGQSATIVATGSVQVAVVEGRTTAVHVRVIDVTGPPPLPDHAPIVVSVTAAPAPLIVGRSVALTVVAVDVDGDQVSYVWTQTCSSTNGVFSAPNSANTSWTPLAAGACTLRVQVTANGLADAATVDVGAIMAPSGAIEISAEFVPNPYVSEVEVSGGGSTSHIYRSGNDATVPFDAVPGANLVVSVHVASGPAKSISLSDDCGGSSIALHSGPSSASFDWTAPSLPGVCVLSASVSADNLTDVFPIALLVRAPNDSELPFVTITNLSGDLSNATNWGTASSSVVLTRLTTAQFMAEQPAAKLPPGHVAANGVLKVSVTRPNGGNAFYGRNMPRTKPFAAARNVTPRWYVPPSMSSRFATINDDNRVQTDFVADAYPTRANYYSQWVRAGRDAPNDGLFQVVCVPITAGSAGTLAAHLSNIDAVIGLPQAGKLQWFQNFVKGDAAASVENPLVIYLLDIVEIAESKPTLYFRWDDATKDHRAVSSHMRNGTKFGGGPLARPLPSTFGIIPAFVGSGLTLQDLREMAAQGSEIVIHGYGANGSTWGSPNSSADMIAEIQAMQAIQAAEGWPMSWRQSVVFPGNNVSSATSDGLRPEAVAESMGLKIGLGGGMTGYGFSFGAMTRPMSSMAVVGFGVTAGRTVANAADAKALIDFLASSRLSIVLMGHVVGTGGVAEATFDEVMDVFANELASPASRIRTADLVGDAVRAGVVSN
jgi:hypothetical protein